MIELNVAPNGAVTIPGEPNMRTEIKLRVGDSIRLRASDGNTTVVTACAPARGACANCVFSVFNGDYHAKEVTGFNCPHQFSSAFVLCDRIAGAVPGTGYFTTAEDLI